ncbi:uL15 family ribosomal protein [Candidatus Woesearchaeota archaeon]|nr:uL15 family ribosomal protein [Candidatus Woesearchaeota archaeon]
MIIKRKKNIRQRGSKTHGYGSMKKNRGAGNRGGRGNAGSGKRADQSKPTMLKNKRRFGKLGFKSKSRKIIISITLRHIEEKLAPLVSEGRATLKDGVYHINLKDIGCDKLLGKGKLLHKYRIECESASKGAIEAVKAAAGEVVIKEPVEKKVADEAIEKSQKKGKGSDGQKDGSDEEPSEEP